MLKMSSKTVFSALAIILLGIAVWYLFFSRVTPPDFAQYEAGPERKDAFFSYFQPRVAKINQQILQDKTKVNENCSASDKANAELNEIAARYNVDKADLKDEPICTILKRRVDTVPASLALAQAANESAWGTSRFAQQGNNFFGQWCFKEGCGLVPKSRDAAKTHEVAVFQSPSASVKSYIMNLNTHNAYLSLRKIRASLRKQGAKVTGLELSKGLDKYSERGTEYGKELRAMIKYNNLVRFDSAVQDK